MRTECDKQASGLRHLVYEPCGNAPLCFLWTDAATTSGCPEAAVERGRERGRTVKCAASEDET